MAIIDLSHNLANGMPVYPGQRTPEFHKVVDSARGIQTTQMHLTSHVGTHCDCPRHFIPGGEVLSEICVERCIGTAIVFHVDSSARKCISRSAAPWTAVSSGDGVLIATGHSVEWGTPQYYDSAPYLSTEVAEILAQRGAKFVGIDFPSPDSIGSDSEPVHHLLLRAGILIIENLKDLHTLPSGAVWFAGPPVPILDGDGGPCRAFAVIP